MSYPFVGVVATPATGGPAQPHPAYAFQYRFPQFNVSSQVPQNIPRVTATGVGPQGETADWHGAPSYPLAQIGKLRGLRGLGEGEWYTNPNWQLALGALSLVGTGLCAYHGYKRNNSVGWAIVWGLLGSLFPIITVPVAFAQGLGKRKGR